jgi:competence protein ComEC
LRINITAFIAGGSLLLFLPAVPEDWLGICAFLLLICIFGCWGNWRLLKLPHASKILIGLFFFVLGFAWNAHYAQNRLNNILPVEYEGKDLLLEGRVNFYFLMKYLVIKMYVINRVIKHLNAVYIKMAS